VPASTIISESPLNCNKPKSLFTILLLGHHPQIKKLLSKAAFFVLPSALPCLGCHSERSEESIKEVIASAALQSHFIIRYWVLDIRYSLPPYPLNTIRYFSPRLLSSIFSLGHSILDIGYSIFPPPYVFRPPSSHLDVRCWMFFPPPSSGQTPSVLLLMARY